SPPSLGSAPHDASGSGREPRRECVVGVKAPAVAPAIALLATFRTRPRSSGLWLLALSAEPRGAGWAGVGYGRPRTPAGLPGGAPIEEPLTGVSIGTVLAIRLTDLEM